MAAEESPSAQSSSDVTQQQPEQSPPSEGTSSTMDAAPAPVLNREQRRAQAKGKKIGPTGANPALGHFNNRANPNTRGGASVEKRLPRTGHK